MKRMISAICILAAGMVLALDCHALTREGTAYGSRVRIEFYDGIFQTQAAKIVVYTDGRGRDNFAIDAEVDDPEGYYKKAEIGWARPGERNRYELPLVYFMMAADAKPGTGYIKISTFEGELCYLPFSYDGKYINWGREFRERIQQEARPAPGASSGRPFYGNAKFRLQILTVPPDCEILMGREQDNFQLLWGNQRPMTISAHDNNEEFKIVIRKAGYQDFEWTGPLGLLGCEDDGSLAKVEFNIIDRTWYHK